MMVKSAQDPMGSYEAGADRGLFPRLEKRFQPKACARWLAIHSAVGCVLPLKPQDLPSPVWFSAMHACVSD